MTGSLFGKKEGKGREHQIKTYICGYSQKVKKKKKTRFQEREVENRPDSFFEEKYNVLGTVKEKTIRKRKELFKNSNKRRINL